MHQAFGWSMLMLMCTAVRVNCVNEVLRATQPVYGIASLAEPSKNRSSCYEQLDLFRKSVDDGKVWAIKALDASGRQEPGFIYGNNLWIGSHSQCKDIANRKRFEVSYDKVKHDPATPYDYPPFEMGFTMLFIRHNSSLQQHTQAPLEFIIQIGLCLPRTCTNEDVFDLSSLYVDGKYLQAQNLFRLNLEVVEVKRLIDDVFWIWTQPKTIFFSTIVVILLLLMIIGTIYDVKRCKAGKNKFINQNCGSNENTNPKNSTKISTSEMVTNPTENISSPIISKFENVLVSFSIYKNTIEMFGTKLPPDAVGCIHGLRFMGMIWVIGVHSIFFQADYMENLSFGFRLSEDLFSQILSNSTYCVDTYLFLSGFLLSYLYYKKKNPHKEQTETSVNLMAKTQEFFMMLVNRILRITTAYAGLIFFSDFLFTYYRHSSSLSSSEQVENACEKYWWRNLLYVNNLFPRSEMCLSWSWYLSVDMQCFTIASFLLILSTVFFNVAAAAVVILILIAMVATALKSYSIGYIPSMDEQLAQLDAIYDLPWNRMGPYMVGVITGYLLMVKLQKKLTITRGTRIFLWTLFPILNLWILFTLYTRQLSVLFSAIYMGISRTLWGVGIAWIVVACFTGNAPALEKFLSFRGFIPLSRLTYCAYLLNPLVANMIFLGGESPYSASLASFSLTVAGVTLLTFYTSFLFSLMFEAPFTSLTKMVFDKVTAKKKEETNGERNEKMQTA